MGIMIGSFIILKLLIYSSASLQDQDATPRIDMSDDEFTASTLGMSYILTSPKHDDGNQEAFNDEYNETSYNHTTETFIFTTVEAVSNTPNDVTKLISTVTASDELSVHSGTTGFSDLSNFTQDYDTNATSIMSEGSVTIDVSNVPGNITRILYLSD